MFHVRQDQEQEEDQEQQQQEHRLRVASLDRLDSGRHSRGEEEGWGGGETAAAAGGRGSECRDGLGSELGLGLCLGWSCERRSCVRRPSLATSIAQGALGLDKFVGRRGRSVQSSSVRRPIGRMAGSR